MVIDLREIYEIPGRGEDFEYKIDPSETEYVKGCKFSEPVSVRGRVRNRSGIVTLSFETKTRLDRVCDKCLREFSEDFSLDFEHSLMLSAQNEMSLEDETCIVTGTYTLDLNDIVLQDILLSLPTRTLCREDCKGLCPLCGHDLNEGPCDCRK
jgi:uncharacterized protein